jgi:two-component system response regulator RegA
MTAAHLSNRILIVEDDPNFRETLALEFEGRGYRVTTAASLASYRARGQHNFDYAVVDLKLGHESGLAIVEELRGAVPRCRVIIMTGYGSIATAVKAVKLGAHDYLPKPTTVSAIERALLADGKQNDDRAALNLKEEPLSLARHEREYIEHVLEQCGGNVSAAARRLGLHRQSLQRKLRKYPPSK